MPSSGEFVATIQPGMISESPVHAIPLEPRLSLVKPSEIQGDLAASWLAIHAGNPGLVSPYYDLGFTQAVARVRDDIEIAVFSADEEIVALLPFQRAKPRHAVPVGGRLNDSHGLLVNPRYSKQVSMRSLIEQTMRAAELDTYSFHSLSQSDESLRACEFEQLGSHYLDLSSGWDEYRRWAKKNSVAIKRQGQKTRRAIKDVGPLRFEFDCRDDEVLESLIELKRAKYQRTNTFDILSVEWASNLLREISTIEQAGFKGLLSAMWAGDQLLAVHFGMLTDQILHYWFPVFDPQFQRYSPGTELLLKVAETAAERGITKLDLGYGDDDYKFRFCNGRETVSCGQVGFSPLSFGIAKQRYHLRQRLKRIPMKATVKSVLRGVFPGFGQWNFR